MNFEAHIPNAFARHESRQDYFDRRHSRMQHGASGIVAMSVSRGGRSDRSGRSGEQGADLGSGEGRFMSRSARFAQKGIMTAIIPEGRRDARRRSRRVCERRRRCRECGLPQHYPMGRGADAALRESDGSRSDGFFAASATLRQLPEILSGDDRDPSWKDHLELDRPVTGRGSARLLRGVNDAGRSSKGEIYGIDNTRMEALTAEYAGVRGSQVRWAR